ncbi:AMP nucleosidase [Chlamydiia bacterium]|nr:AMP nucleosidase [Chlamydiia bacterium]
MYKAGYKEKDEFKQAKAMKEKDIAKSSIERYSGCSIDRFQPYLLLTNFPHYVDYFAKQYNGEVSEGSLFKVAHSSTYRVSIIDFKMGSPMASLVMDLFCHTNIKTMLMLGMCGGLRSKYIVGDFFVPFASIRADGTSDVYFPSEVPACATFDIQRKVMERLDKMKLKYHTGITYTTNTRFWEFNDEFKKRVIDCRAQAIEMECATLFIAGYRYKINIGSLLLVSDLPLENTGVKTQESAAKVFDEYANNHVDVGMEIMQHIQ